MNKLVELFPTNEVCVAICDQILEVFKLATSSFIQLFILLYIQIMSIKPKNYGQFQCIYYHSLQIKVCLFISFFSEIKILFGFSLHKLCWFYITAEKIRAFILHIDVNIKKITGTILNQIKYSYFLQLF